MAVFRITLLITILAAVAVQASRSPESPNAITERQAPGTPLYECHSDCGNALAGGRIASHCDNSTWVDLYEGCLGCALEFDIWKHYSAGLTAAASSCGLTPTPSPAGTVSSTTAGSSLSATSGGGGGGGGASVTPAPTAQTTAGGSGSSTSSSTAGAPAFGTGFQPGTTLVGAVLAMLAALY